MDAIKVFFIIVFLIVLVIIAIYLIIKQSSKVADVKCPVAPGTSDNVLKYVQTLIENTPHKKGLSSELVVQRKDVVQANLDIIHTANLEQQANKNDSNSDKVIVFAANRFLPYTHQEIIQLFTGLIIPEEYRAQTFPNPAPIANGEDLGTGKYFRIDFDKIPSTESRLDIFYGISPRLLTQPRDQGTCGSCWSFSACAVMAAQVTKESVSEKAVGLSEQYYIDCVGENYGCQGGFPIFVYEKIAADKFVVLDDPSGIPYVQEKKDVCKVESSSIPYPVDFKGIISFGKDDAGFFPVDNLKGAEKYRLLDLTVPSKEMIEKIKKILFNYGPLTVLIYVDEQMPYISSGIYTSTDQKQGKKVSANHAVVIAGFGVDLDQEQYWIVRNSWGKDWAESGYFQLSTSSPICGITLPYIGAMDKLPTFPEQD